MAAERVANLKGPGPSTARRDAIHYHYSVGLGSPPPEDEWMLVGDLPKLFLGLDSHGFADFDAAVTLNCSLATYYPKGHAMRAKWNLLRGRAVVLHDLDLDEVRADFGPHRGGHH